RLVMRELRHVRPYRAERLIADPAHQHRGRLLLLAPLDLERLGQELDLLEGPAGVAVAGLAAGRLHDAVERDERGADQRTHDRLLGSLRTWLVAALRARPRRAQLQIATDKKICQEGK